MTVSDLIDYLSQYDDDTVVVLTQSDLESVDEDFDSFICLDSIPDL